jgi:uncharacterized protein (TIGR02186 family)
VKANHIIFYLLLCWASRADAENLIVAFSTDRIAINSNFTGADLTLFGAIEGHERTPTARSYDLVIIARGPSGSVKVRKKEAVGPFWLNREQAVFSSIPSYLAVLTTQTVDDFLDPGLQAQFATNLEAQLAQATPPDTDTTFTQALIHIRREQQMFTDEIGTIDFLSPSLFRATIHLPGSAPLGRYEVRVLAFLDGKNVASEATHFQVNRSGIEHSLAVAANRYGLLYGLMVVAMALIFGWLASVIFRRD